MKVFDLINQKKTDQELLNIPEEEWQWSKNNNIINLPSANLVNLFTIEAVPGIILYWKSQVYNSGNRFYICQVVVKLNM